MTTTSPSLLDEETLDIELLFPEARRFQRRRRATFFLIAIFVLVVVVSALWSAIARTPPTTHLSARNPTRPTKSIPFGFATSGKEILGLTTYQLKTRFTNVHVCRGSRCFGPTTSDTSQGKGPEFSGVGFYQGLADGYLQEMANNTSVAIALNLLRKNLPPDTVFTPVTKLVSPGGDWGQTTGTSKTLGKVMSRFDPQGKFCVFFQAQHSGSNTTYSSVNVQSASIAAWVKGVYQAC
jgi:hypothetical protein